MVVRLFQDVRLRTVVANVKVRIASVSFVMLMLTHSKDLLACSMLSLLPGVRKSTPVRSIVNDLNIFEYDKMFVLIV